VKIAHRQGSDKAYRAPGTVSQVFAALLILLETNMFHGAEPTWAGKHVRRSKATTMGDSADAGNARIEDWASPFTLAWQRVFIEE
jgi:hypothetical protein